MTFPPILLLATACGAPASAGNGSSAQAGSSAYPSELLGTWENDVEGIKFAADGTCIQKYWGDTARRCTYLISTGDVGQPSSDHPWVLQVDEKEANGGDWAWSLEIIAMGPQQFTGRQDGNLDPWRRGPDGDLRDCTGNLQCDAVTDEATCNAVGCDWSDGACSDLGFSCLDLGADQCNQTPGCQLK